MNRVLRLFTAILILAVLLRFFYFDISPPALYSDEANQGYNAYSLMKTGKDEHGIFLPVSLRSFGDWKPPMQTYLAIPFIALFGLNEYTVRLPSMILGVFSIIVTFYLVKELGFRSKFALLTVFFLTISPWHLHQSRSAMLVMVAFFFFELGTLFFLGNVNRKLNLLLSALFLSLAIYSYYGMRLIIPIFFGFLIYYKWVEFTDNKKSLINVSFFFFLFLLPLISAFIRQPDVLFGRAKTVSVFYDRGVELRIWELASQEGSGKVQIVRFFHNKPYLYFLDITRRFFSHLEGQFLFFQGDTASPFRIPNMGVMYLMESIFLLSGVWFLLKRPKLAIFFFLLLAVSLLPASFTFMTPSANRTFNAVFPLIFLAAYGTYSWWNKLRYPRRRALFSLIVVIGYLGQFFFYLHQYYHILPRDYGDQWLYGYKEMVQFVQRLENQHNQIVVMPKSNISYIYFLFYSTGERLLLVSTMERDFTPDEFGFEHVSKMGKYTFLRKGSLDEAKRQYKEKNLFIGTLHEMKESEVITNIFYPNGDVAFVIGR